jgi:alkyl sulfatase BDS1-like metallo-beta-lactamase superfamily hydrolase
MGGTKAVLTRAEADFTDGDYCWVVHIVDHIIWAEPDNMRAHQLAAAAHTQMGYGAENPTWRNAYLSTANKFRNGVPKEDKNHWVLRDVLKGMSPLLLMNSLSIRLTDQGPQDAALSSTGGSRAAGKAIAPSCQMQC